MLNSTTIFRAMIIMTLLCALPLLLGQEKTNNIASIKNTHELNITTLNNSLIKIQAGTTQPDRTLASQIIQLLDIKDHQQYLTIEQSFHQIESPSNVTIKITQTGLLDDSVAGIKYELNLARNLTESPLWKIQKAQRKLLCRRDNKSYYQALPCR